MYSSLMNPVFNLEVLALIDEPLKIIIITMLKNIWKRFTSGAHSEVNE